MLTHITVRANNNIFIRTPAGIDYGHPAFLNADGTSRIYSIWDQTIPIENMKSGRIPDGFLFGAEYLRSNINEALMSDNPKNIVPSVDTNGHGTFLAGVACGNKIDERNFSGVAPLADICVVKCREAKDGLKRYFRIGGDKVVYGEQDIMLGIKYLWQTAVKAEKPLIICFGIGTNIGGMSWRISRK